MALVFEERKHSANNQNYDQGTFTWADGSKYVGEVKNGFANGQGTFTYSSGVQYTGEFQGGISWLGKSMPPKTRVELLDAMLKAARERNVNSVRSNHGIPIEVEGGTFRQYLPFVR